MDSQRKEWRYKDWTPELSLLIDKWKRRLEFYRYQTDYEEVYYNLGIVILVLQHKIVPWNIDNMLAVMLNAELRSMPYLKRKKLITYMAGVYARNFQEKRRVRARRKSSQAGHRSDKSNVSAE